MFADLPKTHDHRIDEHLRRPPKSVGPPSADSGENAQKSDVKCEPWPLLFDFKACHPPCEIAETCSPRDITSQLTPQRGLRNRIVDHEWQVGVVGSSGMAVVGHVVCAIL